MLLLALLCGALAAGCAAGQPFVQRSATSGGQVQLAGQRTKSVTAKRVSSARQRPHVALVARHDDSRSKDVVQAGVRTEITEAADATPEAPATPAPAPEWRLKSIIHAAPEFEEPVPEKPFNDSTAAPRLSFRESWTQPAGKLLDDQRNFYSWDTAAKLGIALGIGAALANSDLDADTRSWYQSHVRTSATDHTVEDLKWLGNGRVTVPLILGLTALTSITDKVPFSSETNEWGTKSLRGFAAGVVPLIFMQKALGSERPGDSPEGSRWAPWKSNHGVSGDAFMAGIPLITAARMAEDPWLKAGLYAASTLPAIGRVNDDAHYFSQAALGWFLAYLAVSAVDYTDTTDGTSRVVPLSINGAMGLGIETHW